MAYCGSNGNWHQDLDVYFLIPPLLKENNPFSANIGTHFSGRPLKDSESESKNSTMTNLEMSYPPIISLITPQVPFVHPILIEMFFVKYTNIPVNKGKIVGRSPRLRLWQSFDNLFISRCNNTLFCISLSTLYKLLSRLIRITRSFFIFVGLFLWSKNLLV